MAGDPRCTCCRPRLWRRPGSTLKPKVRVVQTAHDPDRPYNNPVPGLMHSGVRVFERTCRKDSSLDDFRICWEGLPHVLPHMNPDERIRLIPPSTFRALLHSHAVCSPDPNHLVRQQRSLTPTLCRRSLSIPCRGCATRWTGPCSATLCSRVSSGGIASALPPDTGASRSRCRTAGRCSATWPGSSTNRRRRCRHRPHVSLPLSVPAER